MAKNGPYPVVFPVRGLHEGIGFDIQPAGTTADALNVSGYDAILNRLRGGSRPGLSKYAPTQVNGSHPVQPIMKLSTAVSTTSREEAVTEDFANVLYGGASPGYIGDDLVRWRSATGTRNQSTATVFDAANNWLTLDNDFSVVTNRLTPIAYETTNDVTITIRANGISSASEITSDESTRVGPFIRGSTLCDTGLVARLIRVGANQVQLEIGSFTAGAVASLITSTTKNLNASAVITADLTIRLYESGDTITAVANWPTQAIASLTVSVVSTVNSGESRGGIHARPSTTDATPVTDWRTVSAISYTKKIPATPIVLESLLGTETNPRDSNRYFLPAGWTSTTLNVSTGVATITAGIQSSGTDPDYISVDDTSDLIWDDTVSTANTMRFLEPTNGRSTNTMEFTPIDQHSAVTGSGIGFGVRVDDTRRNGVFYYLRIVGTAQSAITRDYRVESVSLRIIANGVSVASRTIYTASTADERIFKSTGYVRFAYDPVTFTLTLSQNNISLVTDTLSAAEQTQIASFTGTRNVAVLQGLDFDSTAGVPELRFIESSQSVSPVLAKMLAVCNGSIFSITSGIIGATINGSGALVDDFAAAQCQEAFGHAYFVDGTFSRDYNNTTNAVSAWVATDGTLPAGARLIALYRGRIVLSGVVGDPHNWFMSEQGNPHGYNYSPTTPNVKQAVAGNNSDAGLIGDIITALIPFSDDVFVFGGDHTIYQLTGDPAAGGSIDLVSDKTGIAFGKAWAKDPNGVLYFWGQDGVYRWSLGTAPENISKGRLDARLRSVDLTANRITMEWDFLRATLMTLIQPVDSTQPCRVIRWESRTDAWWEDAYPTSFGPSCFFAYDGPDPADQTLIVACRDGYLRQIDETTDNGDDGQLIETNVRYTPFIAETHASEVVLNDVMPVLGNDSGPVYVNVYTGQSAEACQTSSSPRVRRLIAHAGRNSSIRQRIRGYAVQLELSSSGLRRWATEGLVASFADSGRPRQEVKSGT